MLSQLLLSLISCCVSIVHRSSRLHKRSHNVFFLERGSPPPQPKVEGHSSRCLRHTYLLSKICQNMLINRERGESDQHVKSRGLLLKKQFLGTQLFSIAVKASFNYSLSKPYGS